MSFGNIPQHIFLIFWEEFINNNILQNYLKKNNYKYDSLLAYGSSSWIVIVIKNKQKFTIKLEKKKSTRKEMVKKELNNLKIANKVGVGQKVIDYSIKGKFLILEYIEGIPLNLWIKKITEKDAEKLRKCVFLCLKQAFLLDKLGLDHGQLTNSVSNIIIDKKGVPKIVDFEKSSINRKVHNLNMLFSLFFREENPISEKLKKYVLN